MRIGFLSSELTPHHKKNHVSKLENAGCQKILKGTSNLMKDESGTIASVHPSDVLVVVTLDQLAGSIRELFEVLNELEKLRIVVHCVEEDIDTGTPKGKSFVKDLGLIVSFQRALHQKSLERAKAEGNLGGRPPVMNEKSIAGARKLFESGKTPAWKIAEKYNVSLSTLYRYLAK